MTRGQVLQWDSELGTGVLGSDESPGGCWVFWAVMPVEQAADGMGVGSDVHFEWEAVADQDGYAFRATAVWGPGQEPYRSETSTLSPSPYSSTLTIQWDDDAGP